MADLNNPLIAALAPLTSRVRTDVTAKKTKTGNSVWTKEPLTDALMAKHLNGGPARGCAFIKPGQSTTMVSTLDLDSHKGEVSWERMCEVAQAIMDALEFVGAHPMAFSSSGGNGIHIIVMWGTAQDAYSVRQFMLGILEAVGFADGTGGVGKGHVEVFPKQDSVDAGGYGNQCILPLAGKSVPLEPLLGLERMDKDYALTLEWRDSEPVPVVERKDVGGSGGSVSLEELTAALEAIPNSGEHELDYDRWRDVIFGIHHATGGSAEGLELARKFSAKSPKHDAKILEERTWPYIKAKDGGITGRTVLAMAREIGWEGVPDVFEAVVALDSPNGQQPPEPPKFKRDKKGFIEANISNILLALRSASYSGMVIRKDNFKDAIMYAPVGCNQWMTFGDDDYTSLRESLEKRKFKPIGRELIRDAVGLVARENQFDSAIEWLNQQGWDGVGRVSTFLSTYYGVEDSEYGRAVSLYIWSALAGRVLVPGIKADMVPIFVGLQGTFKSTSVKALAPSVESFAEFNLAARDADLSRKMRGCLVGEIGELRGLHTKDLESIKSFLTQTHEKWTPKFKEFEATFPRRLIFFGTTNQDEFLADITGNRRFLPVRVGKVDLDAINRDRNQLWAEGAALFLASGVAFKDAETLAGSVHEEHVITDPWAETVTDWLDAVDPISGEIPRTRKFLRVSEVAFDGIGLDAKGFGKAQEMRIAAVLKQIGYIRKKLRVGKSTIWAFVPCGSDH